MSIFKKSTPDKAASDTYDIDPEHSGRFTRALLSSLDRAVSVQSGVISKYVKNLKKHHPDATDQELQGFINGHWVRFQHGFCMIIIQIGAITANSRCIQRQRLIKRMNSDVMATCDDD